MLTTAQQDTAHTVWSNHCALTVLDSYDVQAFPAGVEVLAGFEEVQDLPTQDILPSMQWRPQMAIAAHC